MLYFLNCILDLYLEVVDGIVVKLVCVWLINFCCGLSFIIEIKNCFFYYLFNLINVLMCN